ncbi:aspartate aminotransferase/aminotransferase [Thermosporothrix hazakensis]|jgi:aspartate/methionine/tyrosine aminotransferase|uniref:Aminotransferase n=2 Tax=Thermosporothrix TaxID=768650 RepID=A0A326U404_THEHA|nr:aminotransferase class I/II-fold pyridoxal phosphate-dependent enzyme [Thermosporothrix hazakensis]PZW25637.1 aspartate aminotransferase/aminotransferase [Thermosporothrix hazakensis]BBH89932.1 aspartate aminotransferase [Thermosporothrix sp. COM3]GCE48132.1 aspartate aminotransferase [Thermosporothrix hazakensis]
MTVTPQQAPKTNLIAYAQQLRAEAEARGEQLPPLLPLHMGEPSFRTPDHIRRAAIATIEQEPISYGPPPGWPWLRTLLAEKVTRVNGYTVRPENVVVTAGGTNALLASFQATLKPGDEVLISDPCFPLYYLQLGTLGVKAVPYTLDPGNDWLPDLEQMEKLITPRTRMLVINTPGNPTGAVFPPQLVHDLLDFARRHKLYLLSDECYDQLVFEGEHVSPGSLLTAGELESNTFIGVYSFSKTYAMTGWRVGYIVTGTGLIRRLEDILLATHTNITLVAQRAAAAALTGPQDCVEEMRAAYQHRRDLAVQLLQEYGRYVYTPHGAFYALIDISPREGRAALDSADFAIKLLEEKQVLTSPGSSYGQVARQYIRISLAASEADIEKGIRAICELADR